MLQAFTETLKRSTSIRIVNIPSTYCLHTIHDIEITIIQNSIRTQQIFRYPPSPPTENCTMVPRHLRFSSARRKFDCTQFRRHGTKFSRIRGPRVIRKLQLCRERYVNSRPRQSLCTQSRHAPLPINLPPIELISILDTHPVTRPCYACRNHRLAEKASSTDVDRTVVN